MCISTRSGGVSPRPLGMNLSFNVGDDPKNVVENRRRLFECMGIPSDSVTTQQQVHGAGVQYVTKPGHVPSCDALFTNVKGIFLAISVADCVPILVYDPITGSVAAIHSGWRGSTLGILEKTIALLTSQCGSNPGNLVAYIGPSASVCCYEVGEEVAERFEAGYVQREAGKKPHLDLKGCNKDLLENSGLQPSNIEVSPLCTICNPELFHSYRRDKERSGRMLGVIGIAE